MAETTKPKGRGPLYECATLVAWLDESPCGVPSTRPRAASFESQRYWRGPVWLSKAKDNNASCAIGPFIRLFDATFNVDAVRSETVHLHVQGPEGYELRGIISMARISRDPLDLMAQTTAAHQYPDGFMLFLGTLFAPIEDRDQPGGGFTHKLGDIVSIRSVHLGKLRNRVTHSEQAAPWRFGLRALIGNLALRGLLSPGRVDR